MRAVDTSVLVRLLVRDDADQAEVAEAFVASGDKSMSRLEGTSELTAGQRGR